MRRIVLATLVLGGLMSTGSYANDQIYHYVITETSGSTSLDPLEADNTNNLPVARMIYATPLETSEQSQLTSTVLESFSYDQSSRTIQWTAKDNLKFDDGTPMTANDIAFAVSRMAYFRPQFPIIEHISGLRAWVKNRSPLKDLPSGIKVDGRKITIHLDKDVAHPLFRFCLELFSIIPKKCVDLESGKVTCASIPASGLYRIEERSANSILFRKRAEVAAKSSTPSRIQFDYVPADQLVSKLTALQPNSVIAGNEIMYKHADMKLLDAKLSMKLTPASRFAAMILNPTAPAFRERKCRQYFAQRFRESYAEIEHKSQAFEASIFTKVLPGYLEPQKLAAGAESPLSQKDAETCQTMLAKAEIPWGYVRGERSVFVEAVEKTLAKIATRPTEPVVANDRRHLIELFSQGKVAITGASSGFWALDPAGDLKMLFTPNLHKVFQYITSDAVLQDSINKLDGDSSQYAKINQYLYDQALFNVYAHLHRFFASPQKGLLTEVPFAITSPAPWQVFRQ